MATLSMESLKKVYETAKADRLKEMKTDWDALIGTASIRPSGPPISNKVWNAYPNENTQTWSLKQMIAMRLRLSNGDRSPFDFLECHKTFQDKVLVFVVVGDDSVTLEDDWKLFPSDALITQLILLKEKNQ